MKKFLFMSVMLTAALCQAVAPALVAQDSDKITIKDPAEYNAYQNALGQTDPAAAASAQEGFLTAYPQSVVKSAVLESLINVYQQQRNNDKALEAATRLLQIEPANTKAIYTAVFYKKLQCGRTQEAQTCADLAALARKGLDLAKPKGRPDAEWKAETSVTYPVYHSALAVYYVAAKKDYKSAVEEYRKELMLYPADATKSGPGLNDTLQLAMAYANLTPPDALNALWFYARAYAYAPATYKEQIEKPLKYWFKKYHGGLDGLETIKAQAAASLFPPNGAPDVKPAPTAAEIAHQVVATTPDLAKLNISDTEFILANAGKEDADKVWTAMKDKLTEVPGVVIEASSTTLKLAVTEDARESKTPDFIVNLKKPLAAREIPAVGVEFKLSPALSLIGAYDSYTQKPATATTLATALIVLRDGEIRPEEKKAAAPAHKPAAGKRK